MQTTRVYECPNCHAEVVESGDDPRTARGRSGEFAARILQCPQCGKTIRYDTGAAQSGDSPASAIIPCEVCGTVVEAYGTDQRFVDHVADHPQLHELHGR